MTKALHRALQQAADVLQEAKSRSLPMGSAALPQDTTSYVEGYGPAGADPITRCCHLASKIRPIVSFFQAWSACSVQRLVMCGLKLPSLLESFVIH